MEYTKGKWIADVRVGCVAVYTGEKVNCIDESQGRRLYYANGYQLKDENGDFVGWEVEPEKVANAHLIAAAPDMYEALNALVRAYNNMSIPELCKQHELWQAAENALLKAEGKES